MVRGEGVCLMGIVKGWEGAGFSVPTISYGRRLGSSGRRAGCIMRTNGGHLPYLIYNILALRAEVDPFFLLYLVRLRTWAEIAALLCTYDFFHSCTIS